MGGVGDRMFRVKCTSGKFEELLGKTVIAYSVRTDNNGYPHFLIYYDNRWLWISAKYFEPIVDIDLYEFLEDKQLGLCLGNAVKYISRAGKKHEQGMTDKEIQDLEKAKWYIDRRIEELEG